MKVRTCANHPALSAAARCQRCDVAMCDECWSWFHDSRPACERCVAELRAGPASRWPFGSAFAVISVAIGVVGARLEREPSLELWIPIGVLGVILGLVIGFTSPKAQGPEPNIVGREPEDPASPEALQHAAHPYRARIARVTRRALPLSGKSTAALLSAALVLSAVLLPVGLRLPRWLEIEAVLGSWWLFLCVLLTVLLYRGFRLVDDHRFAIAPLGGTKAGGSTTKGSDWANVGCADASGCGEAVVVVVALLVAAAAAWLLVEIVVPLVFLFVYYFTVKAIGRVARDRHECAGRLPRSLGWGALFATVCVVPIAFLVWAIQMTLQLRQL